jgi:hypothetical protein
LYLIDFDAFVAPTAQGVETVTVAEGGTYGTQGYCPPDLAAAAAEGDGRVAPRSDRYGRDMLLVELLIMNCGLPPDDPPSTWNRDRFERGYAAWRARGDRDLLRSLSHLEPATLFTLADGDRPSSSELAAALGLSIPAKQGLRRLSRRWSSAPVVLGRPLSSADTGQLARQTYFGRRGAVPATLNFIVPWRWKRSTHPTLWQDIKVVLLLITLPILAMALPIMIIFLLSAIFGRW